MRTPAALLVLVASLAILACGSAAQGPAHPTGRIELGILGDAERFARLTGQRSTIRHSFIGWHQPRSLRSLLHRLRPVPLVAIKTGGVITPLDIARGHGDGFLLELNNALADFGALVYVRPMPEMNGHWNEYSAYNRDGSRRGARHSTAAFRKAFARIALLARGGSARRLDARLKRLGLPGVGRDLPRTQARVVWNPQGFGSPDLPGNSARAYYPGDAYVDVVANDLYRQASGAAWAANEALYRAHPRKAYAIAEWGLWGLDDPTFVRRMADFVRTHPRVEFIAYFNSKPGSLWDLETKPRSRRTYRQAVTPLGR